MERFLSPINNSNNNLNSHKSIDRYLSPIYNDNNNDNNNKNNNQANDFSQKTVISKATSKENVIGNGNGGSNKNRDIINSKYSKFFHNKNDRDAELLSSKRSNIRKVNQLNLNNINKFDDIVNNDKDDNYLNNLNIVSPNLGSSVSVPVLEMTPNHIKKFETNKSLKKAINSVRSNNDLYSIDSNIVIPKKEKVPMNGTKVVADINKILNNELAFASVRNELIGSDNRKFLSKVAKKELNSLFTEKVNYHNDNLNYIQKKEIKYIIYDKNDHEKVTRIDKLGLLDYDDALLHLSDDTTFKIRNYLIQKQDYPFKKEDAVGFDIVIRPEKKFKFNNKEYDKVENLLDYNKNKNEINIINTKKLLVENKKKEA